MVLPAALAGSWVQTASGEIIFQDFFTQTGSGVIMGDDVTDSIPFIDVEGDGWQTPPDATALVLDGAGHLFANTTSGGSATVRLVPNGPFGHMTLTAALQLPTTGVNWIGMGFGQYNQSLASADSQSGPWVQVYNDGSINFFGGANLNNIINFSNAFTNNGSLITLSLTYDAYQGSATLTTVIGGITNVLMSCVPVTNSVGPIVPACAAFQFSATTVIQSNRWLGPVSLNWFPRPAPMVTLPVDTNDMITYPVGLSNGTNDSLQITNILALAEVRGGPPVQVLFNSGETYVIANDSLDALTPFVLANATNVIINGNGCKILIVNPRIGFLHIQNCSNIIIEGFTVDYNPLPYTQGTVVSNLYTGLTGSETAIEFSLEPGYPAPTNANYTDEDAVSNAERWGTFINTNYPGRGEDNHWTIYGYNEVTATTNPGVYKVEMRSVSDMSTINPGDYWCMVSRWNGSSVYSVGDSYQVTFLNLTNYTGAAANFEATATPLINEIDCHVELGPPPAGATHPRAKTSNADGGYFGYTRIGPWVQGCNFTGLSDDVATAYANPFVITNAPAQPTNSFAIWNYDTAGNGGGPPTPVTSYYFRVGDELAFFNAITGVIFDEAVVTNVDLPCISVDHPISGIVNGTYQTNTLVFNLSLNTSAVYLDNQFSNSRIHGIYCRADNMLIAHNTVSGMGLSAISAFPALDLGSPNSFVPTNVVIMDNVLSDCSYSYEAINYNIPDQEPAFALVELHQTCNGSDYVSGTFGISGIRILNNAFLDWRRAPLSLHNVIDYHVIGNYFGPPITNDDLVPLSSDGIADLWSCDYASMQFSGNINATTLPDDETIVEDDDYSVVPNAYQALAGPQLAIGFQSTNTVVSWSSVAPGFVLQQASSIIDDSWVDTVALPCLMGISNTVTVPFTPGTNLFYRVRQR